MIQYRRKIAGADAPSFYAYEWLIDGQPADQATRQRLDRAYQRGEIKVSFAGIFGPAVVDVPTESPDD